VVTRLSPTQVTLLGCQGPVGARAGRPPHRLAGPRLAVRQHAHHLLV